MKGRRFFVLTLSVCLIVAMTTGGPTSTAAAPIHKVSWKCSEFGPGTDSPVDESVVNFWKDVKERSGGRLEVKHYYMAALGPAKDMPDGLKAGMFELTHFTPAFYPEKVPLYNLSYLPMLFPTKKIDMENMVAMSRALDEWLQTPLLKAELAKWGALTIANMNATWFSFISAKKRVTSLAELKGLKVRAIGGVADLLSKNGIATVFLPPPEFYDALSKGTVDVISHNFTLLKSMKLYEVSKYYVPGINLGGSHMAHVVSLKAYNALPDDIKSMIQDRMKKNPEALAKAIVDYYGKAMEVFKKEGMEILEFSPSDTEKLREMSVVMWKEGVDKLEARGLPGKEAFNSLQKSLAKHFANYKPYLMK
jgi:TRAP-type C4-dicarboxylate transport system substrate-binding protein